MVSAVAGNAARGIRGNESASSGAERCDWRRRRQCRDWLGASVHIAFLAGADPRQKVLNGGTNSKARRIGSVEPIRVCTFDGPGAPPVIRTVPWPKIPAKA